MNPDACTLPTAEGPLRLAEFDTLYATAVHRIERGDRTVRMHLTGPDGLAAHVRDLTARESECCSFFAFTLEGTDQDLEAGRRRGRTPGLQARARDKLIEVEARIGDLVTIRDNLRAALDAGCDDLHECATSDCCPLPFQEISTRAAQP